MDFEQTFPLRYLLNLSRRPERRVSCELGFEDCGLEVTRFPAIDSRWVGNKRDFETRGRYAHALSTRLALRSAVQARAEAVFIFEDDVVLSPCFREVLAEIELPDDWGMFYLGCQHWERPEVVSNGLVRLAGALDTHAWGCRAQYFPRLMKAIEGEMLQDDKHRPATDVSLARLQREIPSYAVFPNIAWQGEEHSDLAGGSYSNYQHDGSQKWSSSALAGTLAEAIGCAPYAPVVELGRKEKGWFREQSIPRKKRMTPSASPPDEQPDHEIPEDVTLAAPPPLQHDGKIAFMFVTVGEHKHADVWKTYWDAAPGLVSVYAHTTGRENLDDGWLKAAQIDESHPARWARITVLRAQLALLRAALADERNQFFVFASESCVPIRPLGDLRRLLESDGRSRFQYDTFDEAKESHPQRTERVDARSRIPASYWRFHAQWVFLNREAADLVTTDDLTGHFENVFSPDEEYFGTVLNVKGYPLDSRVAPKDLTWTEWADPANPNPETYARCPSSLLGDLAASGCYFARKFSADSNIADFDLHRARDHA